ncbi:MULTISPECIES: ABC transporter substrate-binding protein [Actinoalloteichus]|uniref:Carbohydrate ABC transporter substrate-binding protein, CUT1 family n=1 Tax=Actinoalloteichus fjordicus TaxID=1612552 RepID=A0AAC9LIB3_9PSEU|nr:MULTISPECIES: extracellular solute-binding protein [Actinoalloteichus]APU16859.1 carbohydrate ABC transporter substrate-binding protein, CUT1 family [Actinoalloteichus fjordicus]APU22924.1 carbohydrate ABC transporter substrate-binding protein, CUT1 family [Actinoalloteichus sp. GBA129-24]
MNTSPRRLARGIGTALVVVLGLTACGSGGDDGPTSASAAEIQAALDEGGSITVWAWEPTLAQTAVDFQELHPGVEVEIVNVGTGDDQYAALQNAHSAGNGGPDVAQIEYFALGQFSVSGAVSDLAGFGAGDLEDLFSPGPWNSVTGGGGVHALPMDSGPMALFYNQDLFEEHGVEVPTTWEEYLDAARALQAADPDVYITSDNGEAGLTTSLIWQAGGRPFTVDGTSVEIDFSDEGTARYTEIWQQLIDEDLVSPINSWTDEWYQGMADGSIASLATGAWMPANLSSGVPSGAGSWRVAPLPQWAAGESAEAENGGSGLAVPTASGNKLLAYAFIDYVTTGEGVVTRLDAGAFPATVAELESEEFLSAELPYFGGQQANQIFADAAAGVADDWSYLPYQAYANSIFNDTVGQAYVSDLPLADALGRWEDSVSAYGVDQGFDVG